MKKLTAVAASTDGCCDSPFLPAGDPDISPDWPGGVYGGALVPALVVVNRGGKTGGYVSDTPYNHYSLLASLEDIFGRRYLGFAGQDGLNRFGLDVYNDYRS